MVVKSSLGSELERHSNPSCSHLYLTFVRQELDGRLLASRRPNQNFVPSRVVRQISLAQRRYQLDDALQRVELTETRGCPLSVMQGQMVGLQSEVEANGIRKGYMSDSERPSLLRMSSAVFWHNRHGCL